MTQQEFNQLLQRYLDGKTTEQEESLLLDWYQSPANQVELHLSDSQKNSIEKSIWRGIRRQMRPAGTSRVVWMAWLSAVAACTLLVLSWVYLSATTTTPGPQALTEELTQAGIEVRNTLSHEQEAVLPDGSVITLSPNSSVVYNKSFNQTRREVFLKGEAFFRVKRDESRPFVVHTGELVTEVLGTSFHIKQNYPGKTTEVVVRSGKVSVYTQNKDRSDERNGVILTQNQRVLFDATTHNISTGIVGDPIPLEAAGKAPALLVFQNSTLEQVLATLTQTYGIEFVISNPKINECRITADLNGLSLFTQLELVCKSIDAGYEKRGAVIFITGEGC
ncbi:FecR family protein [Telluribacter sp.]|jgi:ferric-dicitrate binding protein FerR (iron transport regulator)|uniref:FecR family protein n=1 Tax=Telluribacter sp. TaxID=1978767 RepID=UPI002E1290E1|nr:FecR domain-containing protein [Telluribacter sp.]